MDGENPGDESRGKWELSFHGYLTTAPDGSFIILADAVGQGKSGEVKGLVAKWTLPKDFIIQQKVLFIKC